MPIGYVPQRLQFDRGMPLTVLEFMVMSWQRSPLWFGVRRAYRDRARKLLASFKMDGLEKRRIGALSGGEMQRVLLALALGQEPDLNILYDLIAKLLPLESMQMRFMQQAIVGLMLLAPMVALMGVQVINFRMAFFADAISHSAFTGVALGLIFAIGPCWTMPIFGLLVGLTIVASQRRSSLSTDAVIGVFFSGVIAFGLAVVSRDKNVARDIQRFLYGDILTIENGDIWAMIVLLAVLIVFQAYGYNRMLYIGLNPVVAKVHGVRAAAYQYVYAELLSFVVIFSVRAVGVVSGGVKML